MIILLSPAKIMDFKNPVSCTQFTQARFLQDSAYLIDLLRGLNVDELADLLQINTNLAQLNIDRHFQWKTPFTLSNARQAVMAYDGEVFRGLSAKTLTDDDLEYLQKHLRILSGLYGVLRPLDLIQPYRVEVSSALHNEMGDKLYDFWRNKTTSVLLDDLKASGSPDLVLNLASSEYFKSLQLRKNHIRVIDVEFYEYQHDKFKQIVIYTKKARGMMTRYVVENRIENEEDLKGFASDGYWYDPHQSTENKLVFIR